MKLQRHIMAFLEAQQFDLLSGAVRTTQHYVRAVQAPCPRSGCKGTRSERKT